MFRAMIAERFPDHQVLAEEMGGSTAPTRFRWVFDPLDGTTNYAHGLPIFCASLALEIDGEAAVAAVYDATRQELFTAERGVGAWLNGDALRVSATAEMLEALLGNRLPVRRAGEARSQLRTFGAFLPGPARCADSDRRQSTCAMSRPAGWTASGSETQAVGCCRRRAHRRGSRRPDHRNGRVAIRPRRSTPCRIERTNPRGDA